MTDNKTRSTRRLFRHNSPCPEPGCDGKLKKHYGDWQTDGSWITCDKCGEDPHWPKNVVARREREAAA